jgi:hypothetical protein
MKKLALLLVAGLLTGAVVFAADTSTTTQAPAIQNPTSGIPGMGGFGAGMGWGGMMRGNDLVFQNEALLKNPINVSGTVSFDQNYVVLRTQNKSYVLMFPGFLGLDKSALGNGVQVKVDGYTYKPASIDYKAELDRVVVKAITIGDKTYDASNPPDDPRGGSFGMPNMGRGRAGARGGRW